MPAPEPDYLHARSGIRSWLLTTDHKRIAVMFFVATTLAMMLGGTFAMLLRTKLLIPGPGIMEPITYNRLFTLHGVVMVFMFMIPAIPAVFGNFFLPIMLGAKDLAFPRINLASFYVYLFGATLTLWGMVHGGADTGWTFYAPYATISPTDVAPIAIGVFVLGVSSIMTGLNFIATTHMLRREGLRWHGMPIFVWTLYATSIIQVIATPVLGLSVTLVALDHALAMGMFDPALGGDPVLFEHLFWFYSHPAVYIMILPAMGVVAEIVPTFARKNQFSYKALAYSSLGIAFIGFLTWGHHLFVAGISQLDAALFGVMSMFVAIFSAIKVFTWVGTLYRGSITLETPLLYVFAFIYLFAFGGMTGIAVATTSLDVHWHDTYFVIAHFHFIMIGGTLTAFLGAVHYWFPKMFGRMYPERLGVVSAVLVFGGFNLTFVPQFLLGNAGMPRRYATYPGAVSRAQRGLDTRRVHARRGAPADADVSVVVAVPRQARAGEPVGLARLRVAHAVTAARAQLRRAVRSRARSVRLRRARRSGGRVKLEVQYDSLARQHATARLGMWIFLASESLLFAALFALYAAYRFVYPAEFHAAAAHANVLLGTINTYVLLTSSLTVALVDRCDEAGAPSPRARAARDHDRPRHRVRSVKERRIRRAPRERNRARRPLLVRRAAGARRDALRHAVLLDDRAPRAARRGRSVRARVAVGAALSRADHARLVSLARARRPVLAPRRSRVDLLVAAALPGDVMARTDDEHDTPSARGYVVVWIVLIVLATASLLASSKISGTAGLALSLVIAAVKAALVAAFFMHLAHGRPVHRMAFAAAIAFFLLLVLGMLADVGTRSIASVYVDDVGN